MAKLKINEMFTSIQGEGVDTGRQVLFIRFAGCNLNCAWCDTEFNSVSEEMDSVELVEHISEVFTGIDYVVLTGGEPLIQDRDEIESLCLSLRGQGIRVAVETNGTIAPDRFSVPRLMFDLMAISPKLGSAENKVSAEYTHTAEWSNMCKVQAKFVIANREDMKQAIEYLSDYEFSDSMAVVFQPEASKGTQGFHDMLRYYEEEVGNIPLGRETRFMAQFHKLIDVQ